MFSWLKKKWGAYVEYRKVARQIDPKAFRELAQELREMADVAGRLWPQQHKFQTKIKRIQTEMEQLDKLAGQPEFKRLSPQKRLELRESLIHSRKQLMETMQTAPSPTETLQ